MKVKELITRLKKFDPEKQVFISGENNIFYKEGDVHEGNFMEESTEDEDGYFILTSKNKETEAGVYLEPYE